MDEQRRRSEVQGWFVLESSFLDFEDYRGFEGGKGGGGNRMFLSWTRLGGWAPWFLGLPQFFSKWWWFDSIIGKKGAKRDKKGYRIWNRENNCFPYPILSCSYGVIRISPLPPPSLADHLCGIHMGLHMGCFPRFYALIPITLLPKPIGHRHSLGLLFFSLYLNGMWRVSSISWIIDPKNEDIGGNILNTKLIIPTWYLI